MFYNYIIKNSYFDSIRINMLIYVFPGLTYHGIIFTDNIFCNVFKEKIYNQSMESNQKSIEIIMTEDRMKVILNDLIKEKFIKSKDLKFYSLEKYFELDNCLKSPPEYILCSDIISIDNNDIWSDAIKMLLNKVKNILYLSIQAIAAAMYLYYGRYDINRVIDIVSILEKEKEIIYNKNHMGYELCHHRLIMETI